jgi:ATP-binding cassette subfamily F protein uup
VIISHDRRFLSTLSRSTVWLDRGCTRRLERGFAHFEEWRDTALAEEEREQHKLDRKIVAESWLRYGVTGDERETCAGSASCRRCANSAALFRAVPAMPLSPAGSAAPSGALVIDAKASARVTTARAIVKDFSIRILRGDRIGIAGPNGTGKTTLISLLTGVSPGHGLGSAWFEPRRRHAQSASRQSRSGISTSPRR